ncbi:MAG: taurine catabolism dioxygenase TauD, TfdA family protein [Alphaproteobacteria bacterium]|nr:taurine catabolism dioxygenase TauD, TfdA family protein [Alphaproteobacteria bacterium]
MNFEPLSPSIGAEVQNLDLSQPVNDTTFSAVRDGFHRYQILLFRGQTLTEDQHIAFSRRFGELEIHPAKQYLMPGHPELLVLSNELKADGSRVSIADGGIDWHSDLSFVREPSLGSLLYAVRVPEDPNVFQDTEWASMYHAYETLPESMKRRLEGLRAVHVFDQDQNPRLPPVDGKYRDKHSADLKARTPPVSHPLVRTHPVTRRKVLYVSIRFTIGIENLPKAAGDALLDELFEHQARLGGSYRHRWRKGDLMMWDNRCTNHRAVGSVVPQPHIRRMQRTTVKGDAPF